MRQQKVLEPFSDDYHDKIEVAVDLEVIKVGNAVSLLES